MEALSALSAVSLSAFPDYLIVFLLSRFNRATFSKTGLIALRQRTDATQLKSLPVSTPQALGSEKEQLNQEEQGQSLLNNTLEVIVTPSKLATTADVEMSEHGTVVETASQHKEKSPASGREVSYIPDIPNTKGTELETSARLAVSEIPSEDRDPAVKRSGDYGSWATIPHLLCLMSVH